MLRTGETKRIQGWKLGYVIERIKRCRRTEFLSHRRKGGGEMMQAINSKDTKLTNLGNRESESKNDIFSHRKIAKVVQGKVVSDPVLNVCLLVFSLL